MKGEDFLEAMSYVDEDLIEKAGEVPRRSQWPKALAVAACVALVILVSVWMLGKTFPTQTPPAGENVQISTPADTTLCYLTLDVNPSICLTVRNGKIVGYTALNDDAEPILKDMELAGLTVEEAVPLVLEALIEKGYLAFEEQPPVLLLTAHGGEAPVELLDKATQTVQESLTEHNISGYVVSQQVNDPESVEKLARQYGVSVGKMQYVLNLMGEETTASLNTLSDSTIMELFDMDIQRYLTGFGLGTGVYNENGEKLVYVGRSETVNGYTPWDELPEEIKAEIYRLFTPEDIEILKKPRSWTVVPDVIGMTEAEARKLMNSRNIAVRVAYCDGPEYREQGYREGECYRQSPVPGMRISSDSCVYLMVIGTKE